LFFEGCDYKSAILACDLYLICKIFYHLCRADDDELLFDACKNPFHHGTAYYNNTAVIAHIKIYASNSSLHSKDWSKLNMSPHDHPLMKKNILITGASSGIGEALAYACAKRGMNLALVARRHSRLESLAETLREYYGVQVEVAELDVSHHEKILPIFVGLSELLGHIDIVVANAGILKNRKLADGNIQRDERVFETNVLGAIATSDAAINMFRMQGRGGQIAAISSYSAFFPLPSGAAYSASKAAVASYFNAIRAPLMAERIAVSVIYPGFVKTDLLKGFNSHGLPIIARATDVAEEILNAILAKKRNAIVPKMPWAVIRQVQRLIPAPLLVSLQKLL
jgi:short-subunit dehydrogenase